MFQRLTRIILILNLLLFSNYSFAQQNAEELLQLHVISTTSAMNAIQNPTVGLLVYNDENKCIYAYNGTDWVSEACEKGPFITTETTIEIPINKEETFIIEGINFNLETDISIPGFTGTIDSFKVLSPMKIQVSVTTNNTIGDYDIVVSNHGNLNTSWPQNGVGLLKITGFNGSTQVMAGRTCKTILDDGLSTGDGTYWINPDEGSTDNAFQVYCDMTTDGGGWVKIEYAADLPHAGHFQGQGDSPRWLPNNFTFVLTDAQISSIQNASTEGKQNYRGTCDGVIHYNYGTNNYSYAFGFRFHDNTETVSQQQSYPSTNITVTEDGCKTNNNSSGDTVFEIIDVRVPVINVKSRDNGNNELYGSPLTNNPAWLR